MKQIILITAGFAVIVKSHFLFGLGKLGAQIGSQIGSALGDVANIGIGALSLGEEAIEAGVGAVGAGARAIGRGGHLTNIGESDGLRLFDLGSRDEFNNNQESDTASNEYETGARGTQNQEFHRKGQQQYHRRRHHQTTITKIEHTSTSEEHNMEDSQENDRVDFKTSGYHKHDREGNNYANDIADAAQDVL